MTKTIYSAYFRPVKAVRPFGLTGDNAGGSHTFEIQAATKGEWHKLPVSDMWDRMYLLDKKYQGIPVYGEAIAKDLVNEWRNSIYGGAHGGPAIFVAQGEQATDSEKAHAMNSMLRWCQWIYAKAEEKFLNNKPGDINDLDRDVAEWLGRNPKWLREQPDIATRPCPLCTTEINAAASVCPNCNKIIDPQRYMEFLEGGAALRKQIEALEREAELERLTAPEAIAPVVPPLDPKHAKKGQPVGA